MTEKRRAPESVIRDLCEAAEAFEARYQGGQVLATSQGEWLSKAVGAYRAATAPLRTRTEVDTEIVYVARIWSGSHREPDQRWLERLCSEPTTDSGSSSATAAKESPKDNVAVSAGPAKITCQECGARGQPCISRSKHAGHIVQRERLAGHSGRHQSDRLYWEESDALPPEPEANVFTTRHGDRIHLGEEPDPCSCDEALDLRRVIKHVHSLALEMARVTEGE